MDSGLSFDAFMEDPQLGGYSLPDLSTYQYQLTAYRAADAMPPRPGDMDRLHTLSGRTEWPTAPCREMHNNWCRRAGKSQMNCYRAAWHATDDSHIADLALGERCKVGYTCPSKSQSQDTFNMLKGIFEAPLLAQMIERVTADCISLKNRIDLFVQPASYQTIRGGSKKAEIFDEGSFFYVDGVNNLSELLAASAPSLATINNSRLYLSSSVYKQVGEMPEAKRRYWGRNNAPVLVTKGDWTILRPDIDKRVIDAAMERDPERARAEWYSEERTDLADAFLASWVDDAMCIPDRNIPRSVHDKWNYHAFWDGSGGARDAATLSVAIQEPGRDVTTLVFHHRWPAPHSPAAVVKEASVYLKEYGCRMVTGDRYASNFMVDAFADCGINYQYSKLTRSEIYLEAIPAMATGKYELPKNEPLRREIISLQRRTRSGGRDSVDHPPGGTDDRANSALGSLNLGSKAARTGDFSILEAFEPSPFASPDADLAIELLDARNPAEWDF